MLRGLFSALLAAYASGMRKSRGQPRPLPSQCKPAEVDKSDQRIHDAVAECVQLAFGQDSPAAFVYRYVQELVTSGWTRQDADLVGSRSIGVLNASSLPPKYSWG